MIAMPFGKGDPHSERPHACDNSIQVCLVQLWLVDPCTYNRSCCWLMLLAHEFTNPQQIGRFHDHGPFSSRSRGTPLHDDLKPLLCGAS